MSENDALYLAQELLARTGRGAEHTEIAEVRCRARVRWLSGPGGKRRNLRMNPQSRKTGTGIAHECGPGAPEFGAGIS